MRRYSAGVQRLLLKQSKYEKVIAENALLMYIQYVQRHSSAAATQQLLTADGECIDLGAVEQAVTNGFRLPFMSSLLTNVATKIREMREQGSQPQP